jgi:hypothetical protein
MELGYLFGGHLILVLLDTKIKIRAYVIFEAILIIFIMVYWRIYLS